jgi:peptidoglycan/LPS O-acetylase OafA/YrhL
MRAATLANQACADYDDAGLLAALLRTRKAEIDVRSARAPQKGAVGTRFDWGLQMKVLEGNSDTSRLAYLDGLRGWAAVVVVLCHTFPFYLLRADGPSAEGVRRLLSRGTFWGYVEYAVSTVGIILYRFLTDGETAVYVFFVLSGYVLSVGYVKTKKRELISDQALRRYIRLTVPIAFASLIAFCLMKSGLMYNQRVAAVSGSDWIGDFYQWTPDVISLVRFSLFDVYFNYFNSHSFVFVLWTMHIEFFGSFLVFGVLALFGDLRKRWIPYGIVFIVGWFVGRDLMPMLMGLFIAEMYQCEKVRLLLDKRAAKIVASILLFVAVISPILIFHYVPRSMFDIPGSAAAVIVVVSVMMLRPLQKIFSRRLSRFFGKISFSLYLVHPLVICSFGSWYFIALYEYMSRPVLITSSATFIVVFSIVCARAFMVVDSWGVREARRFSSMVLMRPVPVSRTEATGRHAGAGTSIGVSD